MGSGQSTLASGEGYSQRATAAKKFADSILSLFFAKANLKRLLELHKLEECSKFVFTTAEDLQKQYQKIQISPHLGKKGEILFAPIQELAPGLIKQNATNAESMRLYTELTHSRNENCIHVAYFYVRVFQIYSALALTVINADPTRRRSGIAGLRVAVPQRAALLGGGHQRGGAIPKTGKYGTLLRTSVLASPLSVLVSFLDPVGEASSTRQTLRLSDSRTGLKGMLYLYWEYPTVPKDGELNLEGIYKRVNGVELSTRVNVKKDGNTIVLSLEGPNGSVSQVFTQGVDQVWGFKYEVGEGTGRNDPIPFYDSIQEIFADESVSDVVQQTSTGPAQPVGSASAGQSSSSGFEGFDKLKKLFEDSSSGSKEFPKAYCIARAMTLLNPIFASELPDKSQPYYSQICKKVYDFEGGEALMPRYGTNAKTNIYLRSVVSLYYDDYKYDKAKKTIKLTQTETGRSELQQLSREFAGLYMMPTAGAETFLAADDDKPGSSAMTQFRDIQLCAKKDALIRIEQDQKGREFLTALQTQVIGPMLAFQEEHTKKVNTLLMKIFKVETVNLPGAKPEINLKITDAVKSKGTQGINEMGKEAHKLLREYYRKSEAFYMKGVLMFEKGATAWKI
jgi:hypothetical protein